MRLLWLTPALPVPPHDGARLLAYHLLRRLRARHHLTLVSFWDPAQAEKFVPAARELCDALYLIPLPRRFARPLERAASMFDPWPRWARVCASSAMRAQIAKLARDQVFDAAHLSTGLMAPYLDVVPSIPTVCAAYDALTLVLAERARLETRWAARLYWQLQSRKMGAYEKRWYARATATYVVAARDAEFLHAVDARLDVAVIPNGVDAEYFAPMDLPVDATRVCFTGVMDYPPNEQAARWFAREVLPRLWAHCPELQFWIVGRNPTPALRALTSDARIHVTGYVEDVRPFLARSTVVVCPLPQAGGIKNKLLEALAMAKPVVTTRVCAEALTARPGQDLLLADTPAEMARAVLDLVQNPERGQRIGQSARTYVETHHNWDETARRVEELYARAGGLCPPAHN